MESKTENNMDNMNKGKTQQPNKNSSYRQNVNPDRTKSDKDSGYDSESDFKKQAAQDGEDSQGETEEMNPEQNEKRPDRQDSRDAYLKE